MNACDNCQHPVEAHGENGCRYGIHSTEPCECPMEWYGPPPPLRLVGEHGPELERCGDRFSDPILTDGKPVSRQLRKGHDEDFHRSAGASWTSDAPGRLDAAVDRCRDQAFLPVAGILVCRKSSGHLGDHRSDDGFAWKDTFEGRLTLDRQQVGGSHYRDMPIQPWDIIDAFGLGFYDGNALKYLLRAGRKGSRLEDLQKCRHYLDKLIELEGGGGA